MICYNTPSKSGMKNRVVSSLFMPSSNLLLHSNVLWMTSNIIGDGSRLNYCCLIEEENRTFHPIYTVLINGKN